MVRRDDRGGVVAAAVGVGELERPQPERAGDVGDGGIAGHRGPRAGEPFEPGRRRRERLQRMQRADAHAGPPLQQRARTRRARASPRDGRRARRARSPARPRAAPARWRGREWRRSRAPAPRATSETSAVRVARHGRGGDRRRRVGRAPADADDGPALLEQAERDRRSRAARADQGDGALSFRHGMRQCYRRLAHAFPGRRRRRPARARRRGAAPGRSPRSHIRGCGRVRSGSSSRTSSYRSTSTSRVRGPQRSARTRCASRSMRCASASSACGSSVGVDRDDRVQVRVLRRPADRRGLVDARHRDDVDAVGRGRARRPRTADARAGRRGSSRAARYARLTARRSPLDAHGDVVDHRAHRRVQLAHLDDAPTTRGSARHTSAMRDASRSSKRYCSDETTRLTASHTAP